MKISNRIIFDKSFYSGGGFLDYPENIINPIRGKSPGDSIFPRPPNYREESHLLRNSNERRELFPRIPSLPFKEMRDQKMISQNSLVI